VAKTVTITLAGKPYEALPLAIGPVRRLMAKGHIRAWDEYQRLVSAGQTPTDAQQIAMLDASCELLSEFLRKYPDCTPEWVADNVTFDDFAHIQTMLAASDLKAHEGNSPQTESP
jgi:hypothetical protein